MLYKANREPAWGNANEDATSDVIAATPRGNLAHGQAWAATRYRPEKTVAAQAVAVAAVPVACMQAAPKVWSLFCQRSSGCG